MKNYNIYFFGSNKSFVSSVFLKSLIKFIKVNPQFNIRYVVNTDIYYNLNQKNLIYKLKNKTKLLLFLIFNRKFYSYEKKCHDEYEKNFNIRTQAINNQIKYVQFSDFKSNIKIKNSLLLNVGGEKIFSKSFLKRFLISINYHNAELPRFRGANSNKFSIFHNKIYTYFSFHYINSKIDKGFVFYKKKIKFQKNVNYHLFYELEKIQEASKNIKKILFSALNNKKKKNLLLKKGNYYPLKYYENFFTNINKFSFRKIKRYMDIFGGIYYKGHFITGIKKTNKGIRIKDCDIKITQMKFFPILLYKLFISLSIIRK